MALFDNILNALGRKKQKPKDNGDRNTTGSTVQQQATQQANGQRRQGAQSYSANTPAFNQRPQTKARSFSANTPAYNQQNQTGANPHKSVDTYGILKDEFDKKDKKTVQESAEETVTANNISEKMFGKKGAVKDFADIVTKTPYGERYGGAEHDHTYNDEGSSSSTGGRIVVGENAEQNAKDLYNYYEWRDEALNPDVASTKKIWNQIIGNDTSDDWVKYRVADSKTGRHDSSFAKTTGKAIESGINTYVAGKEGVGQFLSDLTGNEDAKSFAELDNEMIRRASENAMAQTDQGMYARILASDTNNVLNATESALLNSAFGLGMGSTLARGVGLGTMATNVYGGAYGDVRTGRLGEQYRNDIDAARRYALANAAIETGTELIIPDGMVPGADIPTLGNFTGEFAEEFLGGLAEPLSTAALEGDITSKEFWDKAREIYGEQGLEGTLQNAFQSGLEGGLGGVGGAAVAHPVQTVRQAGSDINAIRAERGARQALEAFNNHRAEAKTVSQNAEMDSFKGAVDVNLEARANELRDYLSKGALDSSIGRVKRTAQEVNRRLAEYSAERTGAKVENMEAMLEISNKLGTPFEFTEGKIDGRDAVYDKGRILINSKASNMYDTLFAHEVSHAAEGSADYSRYCNELDKLVEAGLISDTDATGNERYANLTEELVKKGVKSLNDIANYNPSTIRYLFDQGKAFLTGDETNAALNRTMRKLDGAISQAQYENRERTEYKEPPTNLKTFGLSQDDMVLIARLIDDRGDGKVNPNIHRMLVDESGYDELRGASLNDVQNIYRYMRGQDLVEEKPRETKRMEPKPKKQTRKVEETAVDNEVVDAVIAKNDGKVDQNVINNLVDNYGYKALEGTSVEDLQREYDARTSDEETARAEKRANAPEHIKKLLATKGRLRKGFRYGMRSDDIIALANALERFSDDESIDDPTQAVIDFFEPQSEYEERFEILEYLTPQEIWEFVQKYEPKARESLRRKKMFIRDVFPRPTESKLRRSEGMAPESMLVEPSGVIAGQTVDNYYQALQDDIEDKKRGLPALKENESWDNLIKRYEDEISDLKFKRSAATASKITEERSHSRGSDSQYHVREMISRIAIINERIDHDEKKIELAKEVKALEEDLDDIYDKGSRSKVFKKNGMKPISKVALRRELKDLGYEDGLIDRTYERWDDAVEEIMDLEADESLTPEERRRQSLEILAKKPGDRLDEQYFEDVAEQERLDEEERQRRAAKKAERAAKKAERAAKKAAEEAANNAAKDAALKLRGEEMPKTEAPVERAVEEVKAEEAPAEEAKAEEKAEEKPAKKTKKKSKAKVEQETFENVVMKTEEQAPVQQTEETKTEEQSPVQQEEVKAEQPAEEKPKKRGRKKKSAELEAFDNTVMKAEEQAPVEVATQPVEEAKTEASAVQETEQVTFEKVVEEKKPKAPKKRTNVLSTEVLDSATEEENSTAYALTSPGINDMENIPVSKEYSLIKKDLEALTKATPTEVIENELPYLIQKTRIWGDKVSDEDAAKIADVLAKKGKFTKKSAAALSKKLDVDITRGARADSAEPIWKRYNYYADVAKAINKIKSDEVEAMRARRRGNNNVVEEAKAELPTATEAPAPVEAPVKQEAPQVQEETGDIVERAVQAFGEDRNAENLAKYYEGLGISKETAAKMAQQVRDGKNTDIVEQTAARELTQANREEYPEVVDARYAITEINDALRTEEQAVEEPIPSDLADQLRESVEQSAEEEISEATKEIAGGVAETINEFTVEEFEDLFREGGSTSALSTLYSSSGADVDSANALADLIMETGKAKGDQRYATVRDQILAKQRELAELRGKNPNDIKRADIEKLMGKIKTVYSNAKAHGKAIAREEAKAKRQAEKMERDARKYTVKLDETAFTSAEEFADKKFTGKEKETIKEVNKEVGKKRAKQKAKAEAQEEKILDDIEKANQQYYTAHSADAADTAEQQYRARQNAQSTAETIARLSGQQEQAQQGQTQSEQSTQQEQAKAEDNKKSYKETEEEIHKSEQENRDYAFEHSKHRSAERLIKSRSISETIKELIKESYRIKPVIKDKIVKANALKWLREGGLENAVQYAFAYNTSDIRMTEEGMAYMEATVDALNNISKTLETEMKRLEKVFKDNDIETTEKGFLQNGKEVQSFIAKDGTEYDFDSWDALKTEQYERSKQSATVIETVLDAASEAGRIMRMMRFLHDNPITAKSYLEKTLDKINKMYERELKGKKVTIDQSLIDDYLAAETDEAKQAVMKKIEYSVADQLPRQWPDMVRQWRMTAMLLNPRTHIRNSLSNLMTKGLFRINDVVQTGIEQALYKHHVIQESDLRTAVRVSKEMRDAVKWLDEREHFSEEKSGNGKFSFYEARLAAGAFHNTNPVGKFLNDLSRLNTEFLDKREDQPFVVSRARLKLGEMLSAQGYTVKQTKNGDYQILDKGGQAIDTDVLKAMEAAALQDAQESTYHDFNVVAQRLEDFKRTIPLFGPALDIIVPFTKTPANILRRSREFSPIGLAKTILLDGKKVKNGTLSASAYVSRLSRGITGTGMMLVGMLLANLGWLSKPEDDDEEGRVAYYDQNIYGKQDYALHIGDRYYSINWAMPTSAPIIMGAAMADTFRSHGKNALDEVGTDRFHVVARDIGMAISPILEESYLGSLESFAQDLYQGANYGGEWWPKGVPGMTERGFTSIMENLAGQMVPTVGGAINRTFDAKKRTISGNTSFERMRNRAFMNLPGFSGYLEPAIDEKGNEMENLGMFDGSDNPFVRGFGRAVYNTITPMTITEDTHDDLDSALMDVGAAALPRNQTGSGGLKGQIMGDLKSAGMTIGDISAKEYTQVKKTYYGNYRQYAKDYNELAEYNSLGTHTRDGVYKKIEQLALAEAKATYYDKVGSIDDLYTAEQKAAIALKSYGVSPAQFFLMKDCGLTGNRKALYVMSELENLGVADQVMEDILNGKYFPSAVGLNDSIVIKTADEREYAREQYLIEDKYESLESKVAAYRKLSNEEYKANSEKEKEESSEENLKELLDKYDKKHGTHYGDGSTNKKSTSKRSGGSRRRSGGGSSGGSSTATTDEQKLYDKIMKMMMEEGLSKKPSASVKSTFDLSSDAKIFDKIVNGSKSDIEKLKRELGIK